MPSSRPAEVATRRMPKLALSREKLAVTTPLAELLALSRFTGASLLAPSYHFPDELAYAIDLTEFGKGMFADLQAKFPSHAVGDLTAAILASLAADDNMMISAETSDLDTSAVLLGKEIAERRVNYPFVFGRALHDQFIDNFGAVPVQALTPEETQRLVALTPQGVFQQDNLVSGPFGLLRSATTRYLPSQTCGPAIRCTRVSCNALHHVVMRSSVTDASKAFADIIQNHPTTVDLRERLRDAVFPDEEYYRVNHPGGLPWLIGNGFTQSELAGLCDYILAGNVGGLRQTVNELLGRGISRKAPADIVAALDLASMMQLLLLLDDRSLVDSIEILIEQQRIELSPTEIRRSFENRHSNGGYFRVDAEASRLGVRFVPKRRNVTEPRMLAFLKAVYSGSHEKDLQWQLRHESGSDTLEKLENCLQQQDPRATLSRLLLSTGDALERAFAVLGYGRFDMPATPEAESLVIEKILWKLGSPLSAPRSPHAALEQHMSRVQAATAISYDGEESRIQAIRGPGMDMYVALEGFLRSCSEFACWALLNDHYDMRPFDRFRYTRGRAGSFAEAVYAAEAVERREAFPYAPSGGSALSVWVSSFRVLAEVCEDRLAKSETYRRPEWHIPKFARHSDVEKFPLDHTVLFLDLRNESQRRIVDCLRSVSLALTRFDICEARNSLGHPRESFPSNDSVLEAVDAIKASIAYLSSAGLVPTIRKFAGEMRDWLGRRRIRMSEGQGSEVLLTSPNQLMMLNLPSYNAPQIIVPYALFRDSLEPARFEAADDSEWTETWHDLGFIDSWLSRGGAAIGSESVSEMQSSDQVDDGTVTESARDIDSLLG